MVDCFCSHGLLWRPEIPSFFTLRSCIVSVCYYRRALLLFSLHHFHPLLFPCFPLFILFLPPLALFLLPCVPTLTNPPSLPPPHSYKHVHRNPEEAPEEGEFNISSQKAADEAAAAAAAAAALAAGGELNSSLARGGSSGPLLISALSPLPPSLPPSLVLI